jgi:hypothetical protein
MDNKFTFISQFLFPVNKVALLGDFNNWSAGAHILARESENMWSVELELVPGTYGYKFLVNDNIRINDPSAHAFTLNECGELVSAVSIGESGAAMPVMGNDNLRLSDFRFTKSFDMDDIKSADNNEYFPGKDQNVVCRFLLEGKNLAHVVSCFWYTPDNSCFSVSENIIMPGKTENIEQRSLWFWINLQDGGICPGDWTVQIFIDGVMVHQDSFCIVTKNSECPVQDICSNSVDMPPEIPEFSAPLDENMALMDDYREHAVEDEVSLPEVCDMDFVSIVEIEGVDVQNEKYQNPENEFQDENNADFIDINSVIDEMQDYEADSEKIGSTAVDNQEDLILDCFEANIPVVEDLEENHSDRDTRENAAEDDDINVLKLFDDLEDN